MKEWTPAFSHGICQLRWSIHRRFLSAGQSSQRGSSRQCIGWWMVNKSQRAHVLYMIWGASGGIESGRGQCSTTGTFRQSVPTRRLIQIKPGLPGPLSLARLDHRVRNIGKFLLTLCLQMYLPVERKLGRPGSP